MSSSTVTFQPSGTDIPGKVYTVFSALVTFINSQPGVNDWTILVDGSATAGSPSIQSGSYALPLSVSFSALPESDVASGYPTLSGDDVSFTGVNAISFINFPFIQINNLSGPPV